MTTTLTNENIEYLPAELESINCMLCGASDYKNHEIFGNKNQYRYVECISCSNIYLNPRPLYNKEFTTIAYDQYSAHDDLENFGKENSTSRKKIEKFKVAVEELKEKFSKSGSILDLGCATGEFLMAAQESGLRPYGIDISAPMVKHVNEKLGIQARAGQFHELDLSDWGKFDIIYCSHVIEHIPDPNMWMQCFRKYLKDDGILLLNIPNQLAPEKKFQRFLKKLHLHKPKWEAWRTPDHLYEPHAKSMHYLMKKNGFKILDFYTYSSNETKKKNFFGYLFHRYFKWGSKIRIFAQKED